MRTSPLRRPPQVRPVSAFTLIELLAVVAVMVMLLAFTLPILRGGNNMNKTAWDIAGVIEQGRAYAQAQNTYVWAGFNMALVSDTASASVPPAKRIASFLVASKDGTKSQLLANLEHIDKVRVEENVAFVDPAGTDFGATLYPHRASGGTGGTRLDGKPETVFSQSFNPLPDTVRYRKRMTGGSLVPLTTGNLILQIAPDGSVQAVGQGSYHSIELGLQAFRGDTKIAPETSIVQISGMTGRVRVMRPGASPAAAEEE